MKLSNRKNIIRYLPDESAPQRFQWSTQFTRLIYLIFLGVVLIFLVNWVLERTFFFEGDGLIMMQEVGLRAEFDLRVDSILIAEGSEILEGQNLLSCIPLTLNKSVAFAEVPIEKDKNDLITNLQIQGRYLQREILSQKEHIESLKKYNALDGNVRRDILEASRRLLSLQNTYRKTIDELAAMQRVTGQNEPPTHLEWSLDAVINIKSPMQGQVIEIVKDKGEIALKGEPLLKISNQENIRIRGYFLEKDVDKILPGTHLTIHFPDGSTDVGVVGSYYFTTQTAPLEFQNRYEPIRRKIVADIFPIDGNGKNWHHVHMLTVKLRGVVF
jgi:multidrug efflux pump subunit AcrA (membrane-fusion protein)